LDLRPFMAPRKEKYGLDERGRTSLSALNGYRKQKDKEKHHHHHHHHWSSWVSGESNEEEPPVLYRLYAVVVHIGSMLGGHYIAYTALPEPPSSPLPVVPELNSISSTTSPKASLDSMNSANSHPKHPQHSNRIEPSTPSAPTPKSRQWCYVSDTVVRLATIEEVLKSKAYLLFYERVPASSAC